MLSQTITLNPEPGRERLFSGRGGKEESCGIFSRTYLQILIEETSRRVCNVSRQGYYSQKSSEKLLPLELLE